MTLTSKDTKDLLRRQLQEWDLAKTNYDDLSNVQTKEIDFDSFKIRVQFNPARMQSSTALVDSKSIQERKCFLCPQNLPTQQEGLAVNEEYQVLVNPYPIFPEHFTIPTYAHTNQEIKDRFGDMLDLAQSLDKYTIFYNGPKCGASAPDHAHFQAGSRGFLPLEKDIEKIDLRPVYKGFGIVVSKITSYLRNGFLIETVDKQKGVKFLRKLCKNIELKDSETEPMFNIITWFDKPNHVWYSAIFLRAKHRPACYSAVGDDNMLISPGAVDLGGVFITPLEKDFKKISQEDIVNILEEVTISNEELDSIASKIANVNL